MYDNLCVICARLLKQVCSHVFENRTASYKFTVYTIFEDKKNTV